MAGGGADKLHTIALGEFHQTAHSDLHVDGRIAGTVARCANAHRPARRRGSTPHTPTHRSPSQRWPRPQAVRRHYRSPLPACPHCAHALPNPPRRSASDAPPDSASASPRCLPRGRRAPNHPALTRPSDAVPGLGQGSLRGGPAATPTAVAPHFARRSPSRARCSTGPRHPSPMAGLQVLRGSRSRAA